MCVLCVYVCVFVCVCVGVWARVCVRVRVRARVCAYLWRQRRGFVIVIVFRSCYSFSSVLC